MGEDLWSQIQAAQDEWFEHWKRGPQRLTWSTLPPQVGDPAPDFELEDSKGNVVRLHDLWEKGPAVLLFWRHYGCGCGMDRAQRLQAEYEDLVAAGARVVVIGQGEPERAAAYAEKYGVPCPILCDPEREAYRAYGLLDFQSSEVLYDAPMDMQRMEWQAGIEFAQGRQDQGRPPVDSPWQRPGEFVVDR
ncbi:MAG: peroxiredoxin-like family protein, partial [Thermoplasmata archaeon]|nr:peroxiredoxin-like family protein [Thermoplasmata archaeon]